MVTPYFSLATVAMACMVTPYTAKGREMKIVSVSDKRVRALVEKPSLTSVKGLDARETRKISDMIAAIRVADHPRQLQTVQTWRVHELKPNSPGKWSMTVTGNYRLTFRFDEKSREVSEMDYEDYH
jgi:proteic killer suppression protein